jgi:hypothetical protein
MPLTKVWLPGTTETKAFPIYFELTHLVRPTGCFFAYACVERASINTGVYGRRGSG